MSAWSPDHYKFDGGIETIDYIRAVTKNLDGFEAICAANVIKYVSRFSRKAGIEDLEKAGVYLQWLISEVNRKENETDGE